ncbi:hypothetical protein PTTG_03547 [Puccinia triticina 1-1 BBBD Race 1]|uniref:G-patch domain-containing protein n=2 Tax=Puccinia triticina TaxID=208348 RepID=A0A180G4N5_PUCT1|nr:uncharacterized protein PtA15_18A168 [Puccinia triticina]OAV87550.1 hypothetical protein PTTG_03547 [Puccinia triticina 1-1 BBBD Race 1]WAQ93110.1 hypothetical protein PtA15_18A168 [Puccinia triticina]WAR63088.1 hypothetical protein PtB15_18B170 [Puccinia triticina]
MHGGTQSQRLTTVNKKRMRSTPQCPSETSNSMRAKPTIIHDDQAPEEEEDFMSDKFLKQITVESSSETKTYSEKRKRRLLEASTTNQKRSRSQREIEAREEGLSRNLIQSNVAREENVQPESHSKAFQMMLKMGFQPGTSLGLSASNSSSKEPINIVPKSGRAGIGISTKPVSAAKFPRLLFGTEGKLKLTEEESAQREAFLATSRSRFDGRKVEAILGRACRTCEELDRRRRLDSNIFWIHTSQDERGPRLNTLDKLISDDCQNDPDNLAEDADDEEKQNWLALEPSTRLSCTLEYLREEYFYCIWCGCQYESLEELNNECPGEEEDDH